MKTDIILDTDLVVPKQHHSRPHGFVEIRLIIQGKSQVHTWRSIPLTRFSTKNWRADFIRNGLKTPSKDRREA